MKKAYKKPILVSSSIETTETLLSASKDLGHTGGSTDAGNALSNEESQNDIWGNGGSIW